MSRDYPRHLHSPLLLTKTTDYYGHCRRDVLGVIEQQKIAGQRILELGCSSGATGEALKSLLHASTYIGIDGSEQAVGIARDKLDQAHAADLNTVTPDSLSLADQQFDLLLALDVLEHLYDPWDVLARWTALLAPGGHVVVSLPNVQNCAIVSQLVEGRFAYQQEGLLDATHIRFFTQQSVFELLSGAGLSDIKISSVLNPALDMRTVKPQGNSITLGRMTLNNLSSDDIMRLCTFQYIATARKQPAAP